MISYLTSAGPADRAARMIQDLGVKAIAVQADLGTPESGRLLVDAALKYFDTKTIDIIGMHYTTCPHEHSYAEYRTEEAYYPFSNYSEQCCGRQSDEFI